MYIFHYKYDGLPVYILSAVEKRTEREKAYLCTKLMMMIINDDDDDVNDDDFNGDRHNRSMHGKM